MFRTEEYTEGMIQPGDANQSPPGHGQTFPIQQSHMRTKQVRVRVAGYELARVPHVVVAAELRRHPQAFPEVSRHIGVPAVCAVISRGVLSEM